MKDLEIYSEKLGAMVKVSEENADNYAQVIMEYVSSSLVGWSHGGWNNDNGGASSW